jgi:dodecin
MERGLSVLDHVYGVTEIVGSSPDGIDQAIKAAIHRANATLRRLEWFEVVSVRGDLHGGDSVQSFQVTLKVGFRLESKETEHGLMDFAPGPDSR